ncbi:DUF6968 family protein [Nonomuraea dietziae]|uniref:DUF6968 family protein n=1 Tax=Nonomuraea dietziae TaxID=65515 RepID=UPI0034234BDC
MDMMDEIGEVMAERQVEAVAADGARTRVTVRFGRPCPDALSEHGDWCCPHQILGLGEEGVGAAFGVDLLQALLLSVYKSRPPRRGRRADGHRVGAQWGSLTFSRLASL